MISVTQIINEILRQEPTLEENPEYFDFQEAWNNLPDSMIIKIASSIEDYLVDVAGKENVSE